MQRMRGNAAEKCENLRFSRDLGIRFKSEMSSYFRAFETAVTFDKIINKFTDSRSYISEVRKTKRAHKFTIPLYFSIYKDDEK